MLEFRKDCLRSERETIIAFPGEASDARPEFFFAKKRYDSTTLFLTVPETLARDPESDSDPTYHEDDNVTQWCKRFGRNKFAGPSAHRRV